jgi:hypothetical protein
VEDQDTKQKMDNAANEAEKDLENVANDILLPTAKWVRKWYLKNGYKRNIWQKDDSTKKSS